MTIRDFVSASNGSVIVNIEVGDITICVFDSLYWDCLTDSVLDLELHDFTANSIVNGKPEVVIHVSDADDEEPDDGEEDG